MTTVPDSTLETPWPLPGSAEFRGTVQPRIELLGPEPEEARAAAIHALVSASREVLRLGTQCGEQWDLLAEALDFFNEHEEAKFAELRRLATVEAERDRLREALENMLFAADAMSDAPCFVCGYNGAGYFQPSQHKCAERHHAMRTRSSKDSIRAARAALSNEGKTE